MSATVTLINTGPHRVRILHTDGKGQIEALVLPPNPGGAVGAPRVKAPASVCDRRDWEHLQSQGIMRL